MIWQISRKVSTLKIANKKTAAALAASLGLNFMTLMPSEALDSDFSAKYTAKTKQILLAAVQLERFSLNYRLESCKRPLLDKLVFFSTQETGAATGLAFEVCGVQQFGKGRRRLINLNKDALGRGLRSAQIGSIIAASGCGYELASNTWQYLRARNKGIDTASANKYVSTKLREIDELIAQRKAFVDANPEHPAHERAVLEGKILEAMRGSFANEFSQFSTNARTEFVTKNLFYLMNASYNILGACAAEYGWLSLNNPKLNGTSNVLFTVSGALAGATPLLCSAQMWIQRKIMLKQQLRRFNGSQDSIKEMADLIKESQSSTDSMGTLIPSVPATQRLALYSDSNNLFLQQLENELGTMRQLNKVALQTSFMGPAIGGLLMTQGILGTRGYYRYFPTHPKKQMDLSYKGAVCGTVGTSMAVVGNAAWFLASLSYEHQLRKEKRLPEQLIKDRLGHLDEVEKIVSSL